MKLNPPTHRGYTLIELIVALAVLALASVLIIEGLRFGLRAWDAVDTRLSRSDSVSVAQQLLRGRLQELYPYKSSAAARPQPIPLVGQPSEVIFSAPGPHALSGQMLRFRLYLEGAGQIQALKLAWKADSGSATIDSAAPDSVETLLDGVESAAFEYFARGEHDRGAWMSSWVNQAEPPLLVRLRLRFVTGSAADWPTFVVRPRVTIPADCQFDPVSRRCR